MLWKKDKDKANFDITSDVFNAAKPDRQCLSQQKMVQMRWAYSILGVILNVVIFALSIWVIATNMVKRANSVKLAIIFSTGLFAVVSAMVRLVILLTADSSKDVFVLPHILTDVVNLEKELIKLHRTSTMVRIAYWFPLEIHAGLWCGSFPTFEPLLCSVAEWISLRSYARRNMRKLSGSSGCDTQNDDWNEGIAMTNSHISIHGALRDLRAKAKPDNADSASGIAMLDFEHGIKLTTEFLVQVEDSAHAGERLEERVSRTPAWSAV
ncbi:hypothetical protein F66182_4095 [Fusarium sp. NRRL 66182]|nr:hypothetical protein F66182_4095 [Fusarium sp. NRRL 66182]